MTVGRWDKINLGYKNGQDKCIEQGSNDLFSK
jgi:hypothetical protein